MSTVLELVIACNGLMTLFKESLLRLKFNSEMLWPEISLTKRGIINADLENHLKKRPLNKKVLIDQLVSETFSLSL